MSTIVDAASWLLLVSGSLFLLIGAIGLHRLTDFYSRTHAGSVIDTGGAGLILAGLMLQAGISLVTVKLLMIVLFLWFTSPTSTHVLAQGALRDGIKPLARPQKDRRP